MDRRSLLAACAAGLAAAALPPGVLAIAGRTGSAATADTVGLEGATMGTRFSVRLAASAPVADRAALAARVRNVLDGVDHRMSTWRRESELSRLNAGADTDWQALSPDTVRVIRQAQAASAASGGAFDVTVAPLVDLWGFGPPGTVTAPPALRDIARVRVRVGWHRLEVHPELDSVRKRRADTVLDLSGIAKGFGADTVARSLLAAGVSDALVEVGGEVVTLGRRPDGGAWRVGIEHPEPGSRLVHRVVDLKGRAIATSGDYRSFFTHGGRRYSHAIDPRSARPADHALAAASVIADSAMEADCASTALMVLGPDEGLRWASARGIAAHLMLRDAGRLRERWTRAFEPHLLS